jgi:glycosyltransferase involved in cell wall biosynthesis
VYPRVTYWTGIWEPSREALSKQVAQLRRDVAPHAPVVSVAGQRTRLDPAQRVLCLNNRRHWTCWAVARALEPRGDITHVFGAVDSWLYLRVLGRRPILFTVAIPGPLLDRRLYRHVAIFAAESQALARQLRDAGVPAERICCIPPGIDLTAFQPHAMPESTGRLRLLFASTPSLVEEIDVRGLPLLIELARARQDVDIVVPWRNWGNVAASLRAIDAQSPPPNFIVRSGDVADMRAEYARAHATICAFAPGFGKSYPNFVAEGMACGRPALVTEDCGIAELVAAAAAGTVVPRTVDGLVAGIDRLRDGLPAFAANARTAAERHLDVNASHRAYRAIYDRMLRAAARQSAARRSHEPDATHASRDGQDMGGPGIAPVPLHFEKPAQPARH